MRDRLVKLWSILSGIVVVLIILFVFLYSLVKGFKVINLDFIFKGPQGMPLGTEGGIFPAIVGSAYTGILSGLIASVLGIGSAIYLVFYCNSKRLYSLLVLSIQGISGIPSVVIGLFGYSFLIVRLNIPRSVLAASITLAIMIIPFISLRVEKIFKEVDRDIIDASLNLGVSKIHTIFKIVLPQTINKILSSIIVGVFYGIGAAAPIMFTGAVLIGKSNPSILEPFMALPYHLYGLVSEGISMEMAYGTAAVLMIMLIGTNLICRVLVGGDKYGQANRN
ncbi:MAG: ABC transporter permease subunit [Clostridium sp.]